MDTIQLQQSVLQDIASLMGDTEAMKKLQKVLQRLKKGKAAKEANAANEDKAEQDTISDKEIARLIQEI